MSEARLMTDEEAADLEAQPVANRGAVLSETVDNLLYTRKQLVAAVEGALEMSEEGRAAAEDLLDQLGQES